MTMRVSVTVAVAMTVHMRQQRRLLAEGRNACAESDALEHLVEDDDDEQDGKVVGGSQGDADDDRMEDDTELEDSDSKDLGCGGRQGYVLFIDGEVRGRIGLFVSLGRWGLSDGVRVRLSNGVDVTLFGLPVLSLRGSRLTEVLGSVVVTSSFRTVDEPLSDEGSGAENSAGWVRAKTGTLSGVNALAGTVTTVEGRPLSFAFLSNDAPVAEGRAALDRLANSLRNAK